MLRWLDLQKIKAQLRIESTFTDEDTLLEMYGESAEEVLLNHLNRTYEDIIATYGSVPVPIIHASLMLVDVSYQHRNPVSLQNMSIVPYTFDILLKPYMRLTDNNNNNNVNNDHYACNKL